jgi:hypothetical protein
VERRFVWLLLYTPVLWICGALSFFAIFCSLWPFRKPRLWKACLDPVILAWFGIGAVQMLATTLAWAYHTADGPSSLLYRFCSAPVSGWLLIAALLALGKHFHLASPATARAVSMLGIYFVGLGLPLLILAQVLHLTELQWLTPIGHLIPPGLPAARFQFTAQFLVEDEFAGSVLPRIILFYPWATCVGMAGAAVFFISLSQPKSLLSWAGRIGGIFGLLASYSRGAIVSAVLGLVVYLLFSIPRRRAVIASVFAVTGVMVVFYALLVFGKAPTDLVKDASGSVSGLREQSSNARDLLYAETYSRFVKSPYFGYGWQGDILDDYIPLPIGSHSTVYGLLYTGGVLTFAVYAIAVLLLGFRLLTTARYGPKYRAALSIFIVLIVMSYGECIFSFATPVAFVFFWLGSCMATPDRRADRAISDFALNTGNAH